MKSNTKKVHELYHKSTDVQKKIISERNFTYYTLIQLIDRHIPKDGKILDIGCGAGTLDFYYSNKGYKVLGIDLSKKAIMTCNETMRQLNLNNLKFEVKDFPNKIPHGKYDFVLLTEVIEHIPNDKLAIRRIHSMLNPKGKLFLTTPSNNAPLHKWGLSSNFDKRVGHERRYSEKEIRELLEKNNFKIINFYKKESFLRNSFYVFTTLGKVIKLIRGPLVPVFMKLDDSLSKLFGESDFIIIAQKK